MGKPGSGSGKELFHRVRLQNLGMWEGGRGVAGREGSDSAREKRERVQRIGNQERDKQMTDWHIGRERERRREGEQVDG